MNEDYLLQTVANHSTPSNPEVSDYGTPLNEAKVIFVGEAGVGKTSLIARLTEKTFNPRENVTEGIDIVSWLLNINDQSIKLNLWDFGGQEIYYATHQLFLTRRTLYILVFNIRNYVVSNHLEFLDYWLHMIEIFGNNSPILIVENKFDERSVDINHNQQALISKYINNINIKGNIKGIFSVSRLEGIDDLRDFIKQTILSLPHIGDKIPKRWFEIKAALADLDENYIAYEEYQSICVEHGLIKSTDQSVLISFLHDLGSVLYFDNSRLDDTIIINFKWLTEAIYSILDSSLIRDDKGVVSFDSLTKILDCNRYPVNKHRFILDIMQSFQWCYELSNERFLIPNLLSKKIPLEVEIQDWSDSLQFQYRYDFLPENIVFRFIVRQNQFIAQNSVWRNGVVLNLKENIAQIVADFEVKTINIFVIGLPNTRRDALAAIRYELDSINGTFANLQVSERVPIPNYPNFSVDYQTLLAYEREGIREIIPDGMTTPINVQLLMNGIEPFTVYQRDQKLLRKREVLKERISKGLAKLGE
jgi:small GTP-binding protein